MARACHAAHGNPVPGAARSAAVPWSQSLVWSRIPLSNWRNDCLHEQPRFRAATRHGGRGSNLCSLDGSILLRLLVRERGISEAGANREHGPVRDVVNERDLAQALNDRVVVHHDHGVVVADARQLLA